MQFKAKDNIMALTETNHHRNFIFTFITYKKIREYLIVNYFNPA